MIEDIRKTALAHAMTWAGSASLEEIIKVAAIIEAYLTGSSAGPAPVNNAAGSIEQPLDHLIHERAVGDAIHKELSAVGLERLSKFHQSHIESALALTLVESSFLYPLTTSARLKVLERASSLLRSLISQARPEDLDAGFLRERILPPDHSDKQASNSSSIQDGESVRELPTPGSTETVIPGGGTVTEQGTHGRTDDEARS